MSISDLIGVIGGLAGILALGIEGHSLWSKRKPALKLFAPYKMITQYTKKNAPHKDPTTLLFLLIRISNSSDKAAHLYLETLRTELFSKNKWNSTEIVFIDPDAVIDYDFKNEEYLTLGVKYIKPFFKFEPSLILNNEPFSRYLVLNCSSPDILIHAERLRIEVLDCNSEVYTMEAEILHNNPELLLSKLQR